MFSLTPLWGMFFGSILMQRAQAQIKLQCMMSIIMLHHAIKLTVLSPMMGLAMMMNCEGGKIFSTIWWEVIFKSKIHWGAKISDHKKSMELVLWGTSTTKLFLLIDQVQRGAYPSSMVMIMACVWSTGNQGRKNARVHWEWQWDMREVSVMIMNVLSKQGQCVWKGQGANLSIMLCWMLWYHNLYVVVSYAMFIMILS